jgi:hypothetical protein
MTVNANLTSTTPITGESPITVNFILSSLPANLSKIVFDFDDGIFATFKWQNLTIPPAVLSTVPFSANPTDLRNRTISKTFTRNSLLDKTVYNVSASAYSFLTFTPSAYSVTVSGITVQATESTDLSSLKIIKTKYIDDNKLLTVFENQTTGRIYPVFTDPNFNTTSAAATAEYLPLSGSQYVLDHWTPVSISYINNKMSLDATSTGSSDGIIFANNRLQDAIKDIGSNANTFALLTDPCKIRNIQTATPTETFQNNLVRNSLVSRNNRYLSKNANDTVFFSATGEALNNIFKLEFDNNDDVISIVSENINEKKYLTLATNGLSSYFYPYKSDIDHRQRFKYVLNENDGTLLMFCDLSATGSYKALYIGTATTTSTICAVSTLNTNSPSSNVFYLTNTDNSIKTNHVMGSSSIVYETELENNLTVYEDLKIAQRHSFDNNYLFTIEPRAENETNEETHIVVKANNAALKNLLTSKYNTAHHDSLRSYKSLLTNDSIVNDKHNKLLLSYESSKKQIDLISDRLTYFHYPYGTASLPLSSSGLVNDGAIAGVSPEKSDRIWKHQGGYEARTNKGKSLGLQNGVWLCSWLKSGGSSCNSIWLDRWYDPTKISYKLALGADEPNPYIVDTLSTMTLDPGVLYKYFHIGKEYSIKLIEQADFGDNGKILEIKDWDSPDINIINGGINNVSYTNFNESELTLNGTEYITFSANDTFYPEYNITVAGWINFDNWRNAPASQIFGNYYNGGYGVFFDTGVQTDIVVFADKTYGHLFVANTENKYLNDKALPGLSATVTDLSFDHKGHVWVLDGANNKVHVYNPLDNTFIKSVVLPVSSQYTLAANDTQGDFYAYDAQNRRFTRIPNTGSSLTHTPLTSLSSTFISMSALTTFPINGFFIDTSARIQPYIGAIGFEDNNGDMWHYFGSNFVKNNKDYVLHLCGADDVKVDGDYNIWYIKDKTLHKTNREGDLLLSKEYPYLTSGTKKLTITREQTKDGWADFIWIMDGNSFIKYTSDGRFVKISKPKEFLNITQYATRDRNKLNIFLPAKATSYDLYRDSKQIDPGLLDNNYLSVKFDTVAGGFTPTQRILKYNTNTLTKGWHHIAFTFNSIDGAARLYVDGVIRDSIFLGSGNTTISYSQKNKFYIGNTNGFNDLYSQDYLLNQYATMVGKLDDLRVYDKVLTPNDILVLSRKKLEFADMPFLVDVPTRQYLEEIDKFNMHRTPGFKSNVYNIRILNSELNDDTLRENIESAICNAVKKITPIGSKLNKIVWE